MKIKPHQRINKQTDSDKLQGVIRNPFAFYFPIQRGFSRSIQTLRTLGTLVVRAYRGCSVLHDPLQSLKQAHHALNCKY
jgi:hypothetical protein